MEIIGKLIEKRDQRQASATFVVREFVIEVENQRDPRYNDFLLVQMTGDRCSLLDQFQLGEVVVVTCDIRGRKWTAQDGTIRYIMSLNAWRIERPQPQGGMQPQGAYAQPQQQYGQPQNGYAQPQPQNYSQPAPNPSTGAETPGGADDLPF